MWSYAVVISLSKADHQNHTSKVYCLILTTGGAEAFHPYGHPFQLLCADGFIITNDFLRNEAIDVGKVIFVDYTSLWYLGNTGYHLDIPRIMQGIKFDYRQSAVAFRGIREAFSSLYNTFGQSSPASIQRDILVSVQEISLKDNKLEAVTLLGERLSINNRSRNDYQNGGIEEVKLPIRKPTSERDVGDLILLSTDPNESDLHWATCTGILLSGEPKHYPMDIRPRGYCLIINNMSFEDERLNRHCAIHDEENLCALFNDLHFLVHKVNDLENFQMEDICKDYSRIDHSNFDAFVCIVMSHGDTGDKIIGIKGRTVGIEQLMSKFKAKSCPSLAHKPKMFFIQACRGPAKDEFLTQSKGDQDYDAGLTSDSTLARCSSILPQESDFLLGFATVPGYVAYRQSNYGSFYMQALTDVIKRNHRRCHLEEMLLEVNNSVTEKCNQVSAKHSTLRGKVFL